MLSISDEEHEGQCSWSRGSKQRVKVAVEMVWHTCVFWRTGSFY